MPVLRILCRPLQCVQKKELFLTLFLDFGLCGTIARFLAAEKHPTPTSILAQTVSLLPRFSMRPPCAKGSAHG
jgi:hypothetical protein